MPPQSQRYTVRLIKCPHFFFFQMTLIEKTETDEEEIIVMSFPKIKNKPSFNLLFLDVIWIGHIINLTVH